MGKWKLSGLDDDSKGNIKGYVRVLNKHAGVYCGTPISKLTRHIPSKMLDRIMRTARDNVGAVREGARIEDINLEQISSDIVESMTEDDLEAFQRSIPDIIKDLASATQDLAGPGADMARDALGPLRDILGDL